MSNYISALFLTCSILYVIWSWLHLVYCDRVRYCLTQASHAHNGSNTTQLPLLQFEILISDAGPPTCNLRPTSLSAVYNENVSGYLSTSRLVVVTVLFLLLACYVPNVAKRSIWDQCKYVYIDDRPTGDRPTTDLSFRKFQMAISLQPVVR